MARAADALPAAIAALRAAGVPDAARDARALLAHALDIPVARLTLHLSDPMPRAAADRFAIALARRVAREPLSHITGLRQFWGRAFRVTRDVLDPRPETEVLVAAALERPFDTVLDLGTGSGAILVSLLAERPTARGTGTDLSAAALAVARDNAARLGVADRAEFHPGAWFDALPAPARFDLIVSNPPYIAADEMAALLAEVRNHEPGMALTDGGDGLSAYRAIAAGLRAHLAPGGRALFEIGPTQGAAVAALWLAAGLRVAGILPDLDGRDRVVCVEHGPE